MKIELSKEQINTLVAFMHRVDLKGSEALTFCNLMNTIATQVNNPAKEAEGNDNK